MSRSCFLSAGFVTLISQACFNMEDRGEPLFFGTFWSVLVADWNMLSVVTSLTTIWYKLTYGGGFAIAPSNVPGVLLFGWFYFGYTLLQHWTGPWSASTPSFGLIFQEKTRPVMLSRDRRNWVFQQSRCRSLGRSCRGNWYVTPDTRILCLLNSWSGTLHAITPTGRLECGRVYAGLLPAWQCGIRGGCLYIFALNWMFFSVLGWTWGFYPCWW